MNSFLPMIIFMFLSFQSFQDDNEKYYFIFNAKESKMKKYHSHRNGPIRYFFELDRENVIFTPEDSRPNPFRKRISAKDTVNWNVKNISWLNSFTNIQRDSIFIKRSNRKHYIVEKDTLDNQLYLIKVKFIQEIE